MGEEGAQLGEEEAQGEGAGEVEVGQEEVGGEEVVVKTGGEDEVEAEEELAGQMDRLLTTGTHMYTKQIYSASLDTRPHTKLTYHI